MEGLRKGWLSLVVLLALVAGCATQPLHAPPTESGPVVAEHLEERYNQDWTECRPSGTPAVLCSVC